MFWKKKTANAAGFTPKTTDEQTPEMDLDAELFVRNNLTIAARVVVAGLLKNDDRQRSEILRFVKPEFLGEQSFEGYVYSLVRENLEDNARVSLSKIGEQIPAYGPKVYGKPLTRRSLDECYFRWSQILSLDPTPAEVQKAMEIIRTAGQDKGGPKLDPDPDSPK